MTRFVAYPRRCGGIVHKAVNKMMNVDLCKPVIDANVMFLRNTNNKFIIKWRYFPLVNALVICTCQKTFRRIVMRGKRAYRIP